MRQLKHLIFLTLMCLCCTLQALAGYSGSPTEPQQITAENYSTYGFTASNYSAFVGYYGISSAEELYGFAAKVNGGSTSINGVLTADIVVNDSVLNAAGSLNGDGSNFTAWTPIGTESHKYAGTFDGNGHTVSGLYFNNTSTSYVGLFGYVTGGTISNVGVVDSYIRAKQYVGAVVGELYNGTSTINNCFNEATVSANNGLAFAGGIAGHAYGSSSTITNCYNKGKINSTGQYTGGICGILESSASLSNCFNVGSVTSTTTSYLASIAPRWVNGGAVNNSYYLEGTSAVAGDGNSATAADFANGKIAYALNGSTSNGTLTWFQTIGIDSLPVLDTVHSRVYLSAHCPSQFSNTEGVVKEHAECNAIGQCPDCGQFFGYATLIETAAQADSLGLSSSFVGYYAIANAAQLYWFADTVNAGFTSAKGVLVADIVVNDNVLNEDGSLNGTPTYSWTPIGTTSYKFAGTFDGQGHTISGLYVNNYNNYVGLFGYANGATIKNVGVVDSYISGYCNVGGICGYGYYSTITNCHNAATVFASVSGSGCRAGGICGYNYYGTAINCYNTGNISGNGNSVGGIFGYNYYGTATNCYNTGNTKCYGYYVAGISGFSDSGALTNCYNTGTVYGINSSAGGVCGNNSNSAITNCYYTDSCAFDGSNVAQFGIGNGTQGYSTADVEGRTTAATAEEFASGKIAYLLNGSVNGGSVWFQNLSSPVDSLPVLNTVHGKVWLRCDSVFTNEGAHKADRIVKENVVEATFTTAGSYDLVVYCSLCGEEISRTTIEVPMLIAAAQKIELKSMPKVEYVAGEKLDVSGAVVVVTFSNGTTKEVALSAAMVSGFDAKKVGEQKLTVTYTVDGVTLTTTFTVKVEKNTAVDDEAVAEVSIYAINRTIVVETAELAAGYIFVFDANGRLVAKELATSNRTEIAMTRQGLYIVRIGDKAERVVVY